MIADPLIKNYFSDDCGHFSLEEGLLLRIKQLGGKITGISFDQDIIDIGVPEDYLDFCLNTKKWIK